jgi:hypothetical protein
MNGKTAKSGFDRRTLIKGGVAAGVAGAAWASPTIRSARVVALDNSACTAPIQTFVSDDINTNQNNKCDNIVYGSSGNSGATIAVPGLGSFTISADNGVAGGQPGRCSDAPGPSYFFNVGSSGLVCDVTKVQIYNTNTGLTIPGLEFIPTVDGKMPEVPDPSSNSSARVRAVIECCPSANYHA